MTELILKQGSEITYQGKQYRIAFPISLENVLLEDPETAQKITAKITELSPTETTQLNAGKSPLKYPT